MYVVGQKITIAGAISGEIVAEFATDEGRRYAVRLDGAPARIAGTRLARPVVVVHEDKIGTVKPKN